MNEKGKSTLKICEQKLNKMKLKENTLHTIVLTFIILAATSLFAIMCTIAISAWLSISLIALFAVSLSYVVGFDNVLSKNNKKKYYKFHISILPVKLEGKLY